MTSATSAALGRAALVPAGAALVPHDSEARADYQEERIALLGRLFFMLGLFFLVASSVHRRVFFQAGPLSRLPPDPAVLTHVCLLLLQAGVWQSARRRLWSPAMLPFVDAGVCLILLCGQAFQIWHLQLGHAHHQHLMVLLATVCVLMSRAVIVPSKPRTTLLISSLGVIPALVIAFLEGSARGMLGETMSFATVWCIAALVLTTFTSQVIYGLRETAGMAQQLGQYVIERKLGEGGMGEVYLARHTLLRRPTAVKLLPPERAGAKTVARFEREVRATSRLSHPNTVAIYDYGHTNDRVFYYAMEYLDGLDLQRVVQERGALPPSRVIHILAQIAGALSEAHATGLVHRDLKPANVFLCERGGRRDTVKVLDFGLVKDISSEGADPSQTEGNDLVGTPAYLAPESIHTPTQVDGQSDLYAVGAIGYFLLTGGEVFQTKSLIALCIAHLDHVPPRPSERLKRDLPADLEALIMSCLEKLPANRPESAAALQKALLSCDVPPWSAEQADGCWGSARHYA